ncbi:MAG: hypothetical protein GX196_00310 [Clostridiaceae bacterium]|nr:hypothetical protein [Clostridiaceae bacterium]
MSKRIAALLVALLMFQSLLLINAQSDSAGYNHPSEGLLVHYTFEGDVEDVSGNGRHGTAQKDNVLTTFGGEGVAQFDGSAESYISMPYDYMSQVTSFTISVNANMSPSMSLNTQWLWSFANTTSPGAQSGGYLGIIISSWRNGGTIYAITSTGYNNEYYVSNGTSSSASPIPSGKWVNVTITYDYSLSEAKFYLDGALIDTQYFSLNPSSLGTFQTAYIGKSSFPTDDMYIGYVDDFMVYDRALSGEEIMTLAEKAFDMNSKEMLKHLKLGDLSKVRSDLDLPTNIKGNQITWESSNPNVISNTGKVTRTDKYEEVTLTATVNFGSYTRTKSFTATVLPLFESAEEKVEFDKEWFIEKYASKVKYSLREEYTGPEGTTISLTFPQNSQAISPDGTVTRGDKDQKVNVLVTFTNGGYEKSENVEFTVKAKDVYTGYLYVTFGADNTNENLFYCLSRDGVNWVKITDDSTPAAISTKGQGNIRDPQIVRGPEGLTLVHTNGTPPENWSYGAVSSDSFSIWTSYDNLASWDDERIITTIENSYTNWAPEIFWDDIRREYIVTVAIRNTENEQHKIYYMTSPDLVHFSEPQVLFNPGYNAIDATIQYENGKYYIFYKNEEAKGVYPSSKLVVMAETEDLFDPEKYTYYHDRSIFPSSFDIEGPTLFKSLDGSKWYAICDFYAGGTPIMWESETLAGPWTQVRYSTIPSGFRHGSVLPITEEEFQAILDKFNFDFDSIEFIQREKPKDIMPEQRGPILWYKFDGEKSNVVVDYSGNGNHGRYYGNADHADDAKYGNSLYLDGNGSYVKMPNHLLKKVSSITITSWVKLDPSLPRAQRIFDFGSDMNAYMYFSLNSADNRSTVQFTITQAGPAGSQRHPESVRRPLPEDCIDTWIHTAAVLAEQPNGTYTMSIYINGEKFYDDLSGVSIGPWAVGGLNNYIGRSQFLTNGDQDFKGYIDDFRIYNRALSPDEIKALYDFEPSEINFDKEELVAGEKVKASVDVFNDDIDTEEYTLYVALFDEDKLVKVVSATSSIALGESGTIEAEIEIPSGIDPDKCTLKAFLWKGKSLKPHADVKEL